MKVTVTKKTDEQLMRDACSMTFAGTSKQSLLSIYKAEHSPARTQMFWITCEDIPLFVATHYVRHHVGTQPFVLTHRKDRNGGVPQLYEYVLELNKLVNTVLVGTIDKDVFQKEYEKVVYDLLHKTDRYTPTNIGIWVNAQSLIDMAKLRLCNHASKETELVFEEIKRQVKLVDPDLSAMMVRKCVYRNGLCGESCGFNHTKKFKEEMDEYLSYFTEKQRPL